MKQQSIQCGLVRDFLRPEFIREFLAWCATGEPILDEPCPVELLIAHTLRPGTEVLFYGAPLYVITRALKPEIAIESGICTGCSTLCILTAMDKNGKGILYSIDHKPLTPYYYTPRTTLVEAVGEQAAQLADIQSDRWHPIIGDIRRELPRLLARLDGLNLYWQDTGEQPDRLVFELDLARQYAMSGAILAHHNDFDQWDRAVLDGAVQVFGISEPRCHYDTRGVYHNVLRGWQC